MLLSRCRRGCAAADRLHLVPEELGDERVVHPGEVAVDVGGASDPHEQWRTRAHRRDPDANLAEEARRVQPADPFRSELGSLSRKCRSRGGELVHVGGRIAPVTLGAVGPEGCPPGTEQDQ